MNDTLLVKYGKKILAYGFLVFASLISVFPLFWCFISATNSSQEILGGKMLPGTHLLENLNDLLTQQDLFTAFRNSTINTVLVLILALTICSVAGYGFEIFHDKKKDMVMGILMLSMMVPFVAVLVPLFQMFTGMGLVNNYLAFVLPNISTPFLIMLFRNNARAFPKEVIEAARVDGLSEVKIFTQIFMPMMRPTFAAAATITFMNSWNAYLWPKVIFQTEGSTTMPMLVANLMVGYVIDYGVVMTGVAICTLPTVIIFFFLQKSFTEAVAGSVK